MTWQVPVRVGVDQHSPMVLPCGRRPGLPRCPVPGHPHTAEVKASLGPNTVRVFSKLPGSSRPRQLAGLSRSLLSIGAAQFTPECTCRSVRCAGEQLGSHEGSTSNPLCCSACGTGQRCPHPSPACTGGGAARGAVTRAREVRAGSQFGLSFSQIFSESTSRDRSDRRLPGHPPSQCPHPQPPHPGGD